MIIPHETMGDRFQLVRPCAGYISSHTERTLLEGVQRRVFVRINKKM